MSPAMPKWCSRRRWMPPGTRPSASSSSAASHCPTSTASCSPGVRAALRTLRRCCCTALWPSRARAPVRSRRTGAHSSAATAVMAGPKPSRARPSQARPAGRSTRSLPCRAASRYRRAAATNSLSSRWRPARVSARLRSPSAMRPSPRSIGRRAMPPPPPRAPSIRSACDRSSSRWRSACFRSSISPRCRLVTSRWRRLARAPISGA